MFCSSFPIIYPNTPDRTKIASHHKRRIIVRCGADFAMWPYCCDRGRGYIGHAQGWCHHAWDTGIPRTLNAFPGLRHSQCGSQYRYIMTCAPMVAIVPLSESYTNWIPNIEQEARFPDHTQTTKIMPNLEHLIHLKHLIHESWIAMFLIKVREWIQ